MSGERVRSRDRLVARSTAFDEFVETAGHAFRGYVLMHEGESVVVQYGEELLPFDGFQIVFLVTEVHTQHRALRRGPRDRRSALAGFYPRPDHLVVYGFQRLAHDEPLSALNLCSCRSRQRIKLNPYPAHSFPRPAKGVCCRHQWATTRLKRAWMSRLESHWPEQTFQGSKTLVSAYALELCCLEAIRNSSIISLTCLGASRVGK
ncbi:hypothetical protein MPLDJ20_70061 [Mesorhizobium plurifarium]|uniref:Uncharacterized protein n=1 Tax=Mesorhizobium plurifarium TaxID=69974 RepID=A0A090GR07_MESPL|nr:hypothetical protein MPLDJ20_70061 [Mesorhizobium plurifarium]